MLSYRVFLIFLLTIFFYRGGPCTYNPCGSKSLHS